MFLKNLKKKNKKFFKSRTPQNPPISVRVDKKTKTIFLGEKKWKFEFTKTDIKNFFHRNVYRISILTIFVVSLLTVFVSSTSKASVAQLYAGACLGGWENPGNAEGAPQVFDGSEENFNASNSAVLKNRMSEIFCGNFRAEVADKTAVKSVVLKLSWRMGEEKEDLPEEVPLDLESLPSETSSTSSSEETSVTGGKKDNTDSSDEAPEKKPKKGTTIIESSDFTSSLQDILDAPADTPVDFTLIPEKESLPESEPEAPDEEVETPIVQPTETPETDESPAVEDPLPEETEPVVEEANSEEISFFRKIIKTVWAAEAEEVEVPAEITPLPEVPLEIPAEESKPVAVESGDFAPSLQETLDSSVCSLTEEVKEESVVEEVVPEESAEEGIMPSDPESEIDPVESEDFTPSPEENSIASNEDETTDTTTEEEIDVSDIEKVKPEPLARNNDFLEIEYTLDSVNWQHLGFVGSDNWKETEFELPIVDWSDLEKLQVRIKNLPTVDEQPTVYLDSMWIEVTHSKEKILRPAKLENLSLKNGFSFNDELKFDFEFEDKEATGIDKILNPVKDLFSDRKFNVKKVQLVNMYGNKEEVENSLQYDGKNKVSITLDSKKRTLKPGKYTLETYVQTDDGEEIMKQQDFYLGVLAINVNKSVYLPGEKVYLQMAALTDNGHTICDADLWMSVVDPEGKETDFTTEDGSINLSGECSGDSFVNVPDYFSFYYANKEGSYNMKLINLDTGQEIKDSFEVKDRISFAVERTGPTRIYPPAKYQVTMSIIPDQDFNGDIVEYVPDSFEITETSLIITNGSSTLSTASTSENITVGKSEKEEKTTEIVWSANIKKGEVCNLSYEFDAPDISPEFYLLGPLEFYEKQ